MAERRRTKKQTVSITHEDISAVRARCVGLTPGQEQALVLVRAAFRGAHAEFGPGQRCVEELAKTLPQAWVAKAASSVLKAA